MVRTKKHNALKYLYISLAVLVSVFFFLHQNNLKNQIVEEQKSIIKYKSLYDETRKDLETLSTKCDHVGKRSNHNARMRQNHIHSSEDDELDGEDPRAMRDELIHLRELVYDLHSKLKDKGVHAEDIISDVHETRHGKKQFRGEEGEGEGEEEENQNQNENENENKNEELIESKDWTQKEYFTDPKTFKHDSDEADEEEEEEEEEGKGGGEHRVHEDFADSSVNVKAKVSRGNDLLKKRKEDRLRGKRGL